MVTFDVVMAHLFTISHCDVDPNNFVFHENRNFYETSLLVMSILIIFFLNFLCQILTLKSRWCYNMTKMRDFSGIGRPIDPGPSANERRLKNKLPEAFRRAL